MESRVSRAARCLIAHLACLPGARPWSRYILGLKLPGPVPQLLAPGAELVDGLIADPADLERLPVLAEHAEQAHQRQLLGEEPVS